MTMTPSFLSLVCHLDKSTILISTCITCIFTGFLVVLARWYMVTYWWKAMCMDAVMGYITFIRTFIWLSWVGRLFTLVMRTKTMMVYKTTRPMTSFLSFVTFLISTCITCIFGTLARWYMVTYWWKAMCMDAVMGYITFIRTFIRLSWVGRLFTL